MDSHLENGFTVADWQVTPPQGLIARGYTTEHLEPKVMEVLVYLASRPGQVIPREELERNIWRGAIVSDDAVTATIIKLRKALHDDARQPHIIATIPKKGYRLIATVNSNSTKADPPAGSEKSPLAPATKRGWSRIGAGLVLVIAAGLLISLWPRVMPTTKASTPSLLVLPIENLDENTMHDSFVDGITEDLITDLSRMADLKVYASSTTFNYKGRQITPQLLRDELDVDFALQGSARRVNGDLRLNVQLVNIKTGFNLWATRYDRKLADVFEVQDEITTSIADKLSVRLSSAEKQRLTQRSTDNLVAYEYFLEGQRLSREQTMQTNALAREAYQQAINVDPGYGRAYGALAYTLALDYRHGWTTTPVENLERALSLAEQGVMLDSSIPHTYWSLSYVHLRRNEYQKALTAAQESIRIAPNYADGYGLLALINNSLGMPNKAIEYAQQGMQLNPYYTWDYLFNVGYAHYMLGNYKTAIDFLEKAQARNENALPIKMILAACYVNTNQSGNAEWMIEQIRVLNPVTSLTHIDKTITLNEPALKAKLLDDLHSAGLPE